MELRLQTKEQQSLLARYCRTGSNVNLVGATAGRLHNYRRLVYNVVRDALTKTYPLTENLLEKNEWDGLCKAFFAEHTCQHPQVWRMPFELIAYTKAEQPPLIKKYPFLEELLYFEWLEVEYYMMPDKIFPESTSGDVWDGIWHLNPEAEVLHLKYPVHLKNARYISRTDESDYFCLIYRQPETFKVRFINLSPFYAWLMQSMMDKPSSLAAIFPIIQETFGINDAEHLKANVTPFFDKLHIEGMLVK